MHSKEFYKKITSSDKEISQESKRSSSKKRLHDYELDLNKVKKDIKKHKK